MRCTAIDAKKEGFNVYVVEEATQSVDAGEKGWGATKTELQKLNIKIVSINGPKVDMVGNFISERSPCQP